MEADGSNHKLEEWFRRNLSVSRPPGPSPDFLSIAFDKVTYLGGLPEDTARYEERAVVIVDEEGLHERTRSFPWEQMTGVGVEGEERPDSKSDTTLVSRVLSRLGAARTRPYAILSVRRSDGATARFRFESVGPELLREQLTPILAKVGVPFLDESPS